MQAESVNHQEVSQTEVERDAVEKLTSTPSLDQGDANAEISVKETFSTPQRQIKTLMNLSKWTRSQAYNDLLGFILSVNDAVKGKTMLDSCTCSDAVHKIDTLLDTLLSWIEDFPPCEQPHRFGNKSFCKWHQRLTEKSEDVILPLLEVESKQGAVSELKAYLQDAFGNSTRIDYGTGHETSFLFFLCCLYKLNILQISDNQAVVNVILKKYLDVTRKLQMTYCMEPAGSQGVWGLDDFQFVPFIWGSSQLIGHISIRPEHFVDANMIDVHADEFMFFDCVRYINSVKSGPFAEHSNVLWGISSVPNWMKVNSGLIKMYKVEVLSKFPVVQHFVFGTLMSIEEQKTQRQ